MIPILSASYPYTGNGLGGLSDCIEYTVTHEVNGEYEFFMKYPVTGEHFDELAINYFVTAIPDNLTPAQPFRIYRITKPLNGVVTVYARHISYDMSGVVVEPFSAGSLTEAVTVLPSKCTPASPVTIQTERTVATGITLSEPRTLWKLLGGQAGSFLDVYGGEWDFNGLTATLKTRLGSDRGVEIRYGKNMTALEQDATIEATYAGVYPYWYDEESGTVVILPEKYVNVSGALVSGRVLLLDLSGDFDDAPTVAQLRARAEQYIAANSVGSAKTSWKVSFQSLEEENRALESVMLGDTLKVKYSALGVDATSRVVKVEFDGLKERYKTVTIGRVKQNLAAIIVGNNQETQEKIDASAKSAYERAVDAATESIRNGAGTFRLIYNGDNLQEIVSLDNADISLAESVWRWNNGGFGHSADGYNGTYTLALLPDGSINAAVITTGTLNANIIRAGILQDALGLNSWNLATGAFVITNGSINITTSSETYDQIVLTYGNYRSTVKAGGFVFHYKNGDNWIQRATLDVDGVSYYDYAGNRIARLGTNGPTTTSTGSGVLACYAFNDSYFAGLSVHTGTDDTANGAYSAYFTKNGLYVNRGTGSGFFQAIDLTSRDYESALLLRRSNGGSGARLSSGNSNDASSLSLYETSGTPRISLSGTGVMSLYNSDGAITTYITPGSASFFDDQSKVRATIGTAGVSVRNNGGSTRVTAGLSSSDNGLLTLYGSDNAKRTEISALNIYQYNASGTQTMRLDGTNGRIYPLGSSDYIHDFIIAEGYTSPWYWRKWYSGYAEAWARVAHTMSFSQAWGSVYTADIAPEAYPFSFRDGTQPIEQVSAVGAKSGTDNSCWLCNYGGQTGPTHLQTGKYQAIRPVSGSATIRIAYYVRGLL